MEEAGEVERGVGGVDDGKERGVRGEFKLRGINDLQKIMSTVNRILKKKLTRQGS